jgi:hypothetical protein
VSTSAAAAPPRPASKLVPLRRNRDFQRLWIGQVVSTLGTRISSIGLPAARGTIPLGSLAAGILAQGLGADRALLVIAAVMALVTVSFTAPRMIRQAPSIDELLRTPRLQLAEKSQHTVGSRS